MSFPFHCLTKQAVEFIQLVDVIFPAGQRVAFETAEREAPLHQQVWLIDGVMEIGHSASTWQLEPGDCLAFRLDAPVTFFNPGPRAARYLVAITGARP